ncbi:MAG TPA: GAF domain-containing protein [Vicinamibacterales bacterium]|nr:GAF domain-containing protein [Vicinamibacterales bacterium]
MEPHSSAAGSAAHLLLSLLADGRGRNDAVSLLHERALMAAGGSCSLLFEPHPASGHLQATSGAGVEALPTVPWGGEGREAAFINRVFAERVVTAVPELAQDLPQLHTLLQRSSAVLVPLANDGRRLGMLAIGMDSDAPAAAGRLRASDVPPGFLLALELSRLRQREEFEHDIRELLDTFSEQLSTTPDLSRALEPLCEAATRLFAADRTTVWVHDRDSRSMIPVASSDAAYRADAQPVRADDTLAPAAVALRTQRAGLATSQAEATSVLTVPLRGYRRALGTLVFEGVRIEPGDAISLLIRADELGRQLSSAVETSQLLGVVTQSRREFEQLFASVAHLIVVLDAEGRIVRLNQAFATAVGRDMDALRGQPLDSCVGPELSAWVGSLAMPLPQPALAELTDAVLQGPYVITVTDLASENGGHGGRVIVARRGADHLNAGT